MTHLVDTWGYWAVALFVLAESFGVPLPGETALIVAGAYAGHSHRLSPWLIFVVAAASAVAGGELGYVLGRFGGYRLVQRWGHKVRLDERKLRISRYLFEAHGSKVVFFGRFVSILRTYAALLAGTSRMKALPFAIANAAGALLWAGIFTYASYIAGNTLRRMSSTITWILVGVAVAVIAATLLLARHRMAELAVRADAAYADRSD
jgi:membrane protein DedA with SNARE-associated domain